MSWGSEYPGWSEESDRESDEYNRRREELFRAQCIYVLRWIVAGLLSLPVAAAGMHVAAYLLFPVMVHQHAMPLGWQSFILHLVQWTTYILSCWFIYRHSRGLVRWMIRDESAD